MMLPVYFAQKAFIISCDCLLAVRRDSSDSNNPHRWEVPGGRLESDEDLEQHLRREVFEETGIEVVPGEPFYIWKWDVKPSESHLPSAIVAVARICTAVTYSLNADGRVDGDCLDVMEWIPLSKLREYDWIPNMLPVLEAFLVRLRSFEKQKGVDCK